MDFPSYKVNGCETSDSIRNNPIQEAQAKEAPQAPRRKQSSHAKEVKNQFWDQFKMSPIHCKGKYHILLTCSFRVLRRSLQ
jgi:hypothetical protein